MKYTMERASVIPDEDVDPSPFILAIKYATEPMMFRNKITEYAANHTHTHTHTNIHTYTLSGTTRMGR